MYESSTLDLQIILIKKQPLFSQLTDDETKELASLFVEKKLPVGAFLVKEGDPVDSIYLIAQGTADVIRTSFEDGKPKTSSVAILSASDAVGLNETGFYSLSGRRTASVLALTDMIVYMLSVASFHGFALSHSHVSEVMRKHSTDAIENNT